MTDQDDVARDLVQRAHAEEIRPGFDIEAGVSDVLTRAGVSQLALAAPADANRHRLLDELQPAPPNTVTREKVAPFPPRPTRVLERRRQEGRRRFVLRVENILVEVGLVQFGNSVAGGRTTIIPEVVSVDEMPMRLTIQLLPGQMPKDFDEKAERIAYALDVAEVVVDQLGPSLIQLRLVPKIRRAEAEGLAPMPRPAAHRGAPPPANSW